MRASGGKLRAVYLTGIMLFAALTMPIAVAPAGAAGNVSVGSEAYTYADLSQVSSGTPQVVSTSVSAFGGTNAGNTGDLLVEPKLQQGLVTVELWYDVNSDGTVDDSDTQNLTVGGYDRTTQFNVTVTMQHFTPYMLQFYGNLVDVSGWNTTYDPASGNITATVAASPIELDKMDAPTSFDGNKQAETNFDAIVRFSFNSLEGLSPREKASLNGSVQLTNSQNLTAPTYHAPGSPGGPQLVYDAAAPSRETDGSDNQGFFETYLPEGLLEAWGDPSVSQLQSVSGGSISITNTEFTRVRHNGNRNGVLVNISHTYSAGSVGVETAPAFINGTVTDGGGSVANAPVVLEYAGRANQFVASVTTDLNGDYSFEAPDPTRQYEVIVDDPDYTIETAGPIGVTSGQTNTTDVTLNRGGLINGTVTDSNGTAVSGVSVQAYTDPGGTFARSVTTNASGHYSLRLDAGTYEVVVDDQRFSLSLTPGVSVSQGQTTDQDIEVERLAGTGYINGTIQDSDGDPLSGATVFAASSDYTSFGTSDPTGQNGEFSIQVRQGTYSLRVDASSYPTKLVPDVEVSENQTTSPTITLEQPGYITGTVSYANGSAASGVQVTAETGDGVIPTATNSSGGFNITVPPGTHQLTVFATGWTASSKERSVSAGQSANADFTLRNTTIVQESIEITDGPGRETNLGVRSALLGGLLQAQLVDEGNTSLPAGQVGAPQELEALGVTGNTTFRLNITVTNFTANSLLWGLDNARWNTSENTTVTNGTDITITGSPTTMQANTNRNLGPLIQKDPSQVQWSTGTSDRATTGFNQTVYLALFNLGSVPAELRDALKGMSVTTNAQTFSIPSIENDTLRVWVAAPSLTVDGLDHSGFYQAEIPQSQLDTWGVTDPETELNALYKGDSANFTVTDTADGARIRIDNITYSAGYVEIQANPPSDDSGSSGGGGGGSDAETTPAPTPAPGTEAPAETPSRSTPDPGPAATETPTDTTVTPEPTAPTPTERPTTSATDTAGQPGFGIIIVFVSFLVATVLSRRRKRDSTE